MTVTRVGVTEQSRRVRLCSPVGGETGAASASLTNRVGRTDGLTLANIEIILQRTAASSNSQNFECPKPPVILAPSRS